MGPIGLGPFFVFSRRTKQERKVMKYKNYGDAPTTAPTPPPPRIPMGPSCYLQTLTGLTCYRCGTFLGHNDTPSQRFNSKMFHHKIVPMPECCTIKTLFITPNRTNVARSSPLFITPNKITLRIHNVIYNP